MNERRPSWQEQNPENGVLSRQRRKPRTLLIVNFKTRPDDSKGFFFEQDVRHDAVASN
jgi:hypothetical protein